MQQNQIWMPFLTIGISSLLIASCGKTITDYRVKGEFRYINYLNDTVTIKIYGRINGATFDEFKIAPKDSVMLTTDGETIEKTASPENYLPAISGDTTKLVFDDTLCYVEYNRKGAILQNIKSYTYTKRGDRDYVFYYSIDSSLLKLATKCK